MDAKPLQQRLQIVVGRSLSSVVFIHDYIHSIFNGPTLTALTLPEFARAGNPLKPRQSGYCDALCSQIGKVVKNVDVTRQRTNRPF
jgi:hypothetical protein